MYVCISISVFEFGLLFSHWNLCCCECFLNNHCIYTLCCGVVRLAISWLGFFFFTQKLLKRQRGRAGVETGKFAVQNVLDRFGVFPYSAMSFQSVTFLPKAIINILWVITFFFLFLFFLFYIIDVGGKKSMYSHRFGIQ